MENLQISNGKIIIIIITLRRLKPSLFYESDLGEMVRILKADEHLIPSCISSLLQRFVFV